MENDGVNHCSLGDRVFCQILEMSMGFISRHDISRVTLAEWCDEGQWSIESMELWKAKKSDNLCQVLVWEDCEMCLVLPHMACSPPLT